MGQRLRCNHGPGRRTVLASTLAAAGLAAVACGAERNNPNPAHTDVLFIGAHPDDEYINLSSFGLWRERDGMSTGVVTITRGEGGGNAVGLAEGPALGLIRETEERRATGLVGIQNIYYLDQPDFWYTLSAPLTARVWSADTLERVVRLVRATTPHTIVVMDPRPFNQHGGHQLSARFGIEAFRLAADPKSFPQQLTAEGLKPWRPTRLLTQNYGFDNVLGPDAAKQHRTDPATGLPLLAVWSGERSREHKVSWAQVERNAARIYRTQGFEAMPAQVPTAAEQLGSDWFTVLADDGKFLEAPVRRQQGLKPLYAEFQSWTERIGLPWLANSAQPDYPVNPSTTVPAVPVAPPLDGLDTPEKYPGPMLPLRFWQGTEQAAAGCSATAKLARHEDDLYVLVTVTDDREGAALAADDVKRHWRTDSVEIDIDPLGTAEDTSTTFKTGIVPQVARHGGPVAERDGDNHQGSAAQTAPGMQVTARISEPYRGYSVEAKIPLGELPSAVDPAKFAVNILVYDSDTEDHTGQTRLAWSPFGSAQADPYVWGTARLDGYTPPPGRSPIPTEPVLPKSAARSADAPASVTQAKRTGIPIAGNPR